MNSFSEDFGVFFLVFFFGFISRTWIPVILFSRYLLAFFLEKKSPGILISGLYFQWHFFQGLEKIRTFFQCFYFQVFFLNLFFLGLSYIDSFHHKRTFFQELFCMKSYKNEDFSSRFFFSSDSFLQDFYSIDFFPWDFIGSPHTILGKKVPGI